MTDKSNHVWCELLTLNSDPTTVLGTPPPNTTHLSQTYESELHGFLLGQLRRVAGLIEIEPPELRVNYNIGGATASCNVISYNPLWLDAKVARYHDDHSCIYTIVVGMLGHEVSHIYHSDQYMTSQPHNHSVELRADRMAGWVLGQFGYEVSDLQSVWSEFVAVASTTHPPIHQRLEAVKAGFLRGAAKLPWA